MPATMDDQGRPVLAVTASCRIPVSELTFRYSPPGGPGGQHANVTRSRVEVTFDAATSPSLGPRQRARIVERFGASVRAVAGEHRSQARNRELALERLAARLANALRQQPARRATVPPSGARERRLSAKRRRSELKRSRSSPYPGQ